MYLEFTPTGVEFAYRRGLFPMYHEEINTIHWYRPDPRTVIPLDGFHVSRSLAKTLRRGIFNARFDTDFEGVMRCCADRAEGTWISEEFISVYTALHRVGKAHSVEIYRNERLVGGTYGVALGGAFMAESMFHRETDASKVALYHLVSQLNQRGYVLLDVQYLTSHLESLGAIEITHRQYYDKLKRALRMDCTFLGSDFVSEPRIEIVEDKFEDTVKNTVENTVENTFDGSMG